MDLQMYNNDSHDSIENDFITDYSSPNFNNRISSIILHHTATDKFETTSHIFLKPNGVSSHFVVDQDGKIYKFVDEDKRAYHAGISFWRNRTDLNDTSIGIEIQNNGHEPFSVEQSNSVNILCKYLMDKYEVLPRNILAHSDIAPDRKSDPSGYYDWKGTYEHLGVFSDVYKSDMSHEEQMNVLLNSSSSSEEILELQKKLSDFGYKIALNGKYDDQTKNVVNAFNRHFTNDVAFIKEEVIDNKTVVNSKNTLWYSLSEERLNKLLKNCMNN